MHNELFEDNMFEDLNHGTARIDRRSQLYSEEHTAARQVTLTQPIRTSIATPSPTTTNDPQNGPRTKQTRPAGTAGSKVSRRVARADTRWGRKLLLPAPERFVGPTGLEPMTFWV